MHQFLRQRHQFLALLFGCAFATTVQGSNLSIPASEEGAAFFTSNGQSYAGQFSVTHSTLSVTIDGMYFRGGFIQAAGDQSALPLSVASGGNWGRAFLFGSSAEVLQCRLDTGFPALTGECVRTDGRKFLLRATSQ